MLPGQELMQLQSFLGKMSLELALASKGIARKTSSCKDWLNYPCCQGSSACGWNEGRVIVASIDDSICNWTCQRRERSILVAAL